jgi:hypothetical protein
MNRLLSGIALMIFYSDNISDYMQYSMEYDWHKGNVKDNINKNKKEIPDYYKYAIESSEDIW